MGKKAALFDTEEFNISKESETKKQPETVASMSIENKQESLPAGKNKFTPVPAPKKRKYELREERVSLRIKPSMKDNLDKLSIIHGKSLNNFIEYVLEEYIKNNRDAISAYDAEMNAINGREY